MPTILPQLFLPYASNSNYYNIPLYSQTQDNQGFKFPLIGFGIEDQSNPELLESPEEVEMRGGELVRTALHNIRELALEWKTIKEGNEQYLIANDHPYSTEKILDKAFMNKASEVLGAPLLMVGIPCRGIILAADFVSSGLKKVMEAMIVQYYNDVSKTQVSDLLYLVKDGQIIDVEPIRKVSGNEAAFERTVTEELPAEFKSSVSEMKILNGDIYYKVMVGAKAENVLAEGCYKLIIQILHNHGLKKNFTGLIEMQAMNNELKKTGATERGINTFFDKLSNSTVLQQWANRYQKKVEISFLFGEDFRTGSFENKYVLTIKPKGQT